MKAVSQCWIETTQNFTGIIPTRITKQNNPLLILMQIMALLRLKFGSSFVCKLLNEVCIPVSIIRNVECAVLHIALVKLWRNVK